MVLSFIKKTSCENSQTFLEDERKSHILKTMNISTFPRFVLENQKLMFSEENNTNPFMDKNKKPSVHEEFINLKLQECY